ncbi:cation diffusion facilitator family transporter [Sediminibacterium soli]|uniref:cation diffusion facilitator family transporter n=1 Tax=Sediminibacterium soli TaxID=2698829 RepID=UPI00293B94A9|nr:cation diffusion facilitator family transporter [Sediminibacterium soli]
MLSVVLFLAKIIAYQITHSLAILTDALESIVNVIAGFIGLYSLYVAGKPRDLDHPYGHGKAEFVSAAIEGGLIVAAGVMIVYETVLNFIAHKPIEQLDSGLWLIAATALLNFIAGSVCLRMGRKNNSLALTASGKHLQTDTYTTFGIIAGLLLMLFTKLYWFDSLIALGMSTIVIYNGYRIVRASLAGIMDEADIQLLKKFVRILNENRPPSWIDLHNLRVIKYGSLLHVDCHFTLPWYLNLKEAHKEIDLLTDLIKKEFGDAIELFIHTDPCLPESCPLCIKTDCPVRQHPFERKVEWTLENVLLNEKHRLQGEI